MRQFLLLILASTLPLAGCGEPVSDNHFANTADPGAVADAVTVVAAPVRIGEYGPSFDACATVGTTRHVEPGAPLPVRSAPFETGSQTGAIQAGGRFFVCSRSLDQKWFGIVWDEAGGPAQSCGVSDPVTARRAYDGPCRSGWVASPFVKLIAGLDKPPAAAESPPVPATSSPSNGGG
jgi:hypothetical protein